MALSFGPGANPPKKLSKNDDSVCLLDSDAASTKRRLVTVAEELANLSLSATADNSHSPSPSSASASSASIEHYLTTFEPPSPPSDPSFLQATLLTPLLPQSPNVKSTVIVDGKDTSRLPAEYYAAASAARSRLKTAQLLAAKSWQRLSRAQFEYNRSRREVEIAQEFLDRVEKRLGATDKDFMRWSPLGVDNDAQGEISPSLSIQAPSVSRGGDVLTKEGSIIASNMDSGEILMTSPGEKSGLESIRTATITLGTSGSMTSTRSSSSGSGSPGSMVSSIGLASDIGEGRYLDTIPQVLSLKSLTPSPCGKHSRHLLGETVLLSSDSSYSRTGIDNSPSSSAGSVSSGSVNVASTKGSSGEGSSPMLSSGIGKAMASGDTAINTPSNISRHTTGYYVAASAAKRRLSTAQLLAAKSRQNLSRAQFEYDRSRQEEKIALEFLNRVQRRWEVIDNVDFGMEPRLE